MIVFINQQYSLEKIEPSISPGRFDLPGTIGGLIYLIVVWVPFISYCLHAILSLLETKR
jgi:hypothetical protein